MATAFPLRTVPALHAGLGAIDARLAALYADLEHLSDAQDAERGRLEDRRDEVIAELKAMLEAATGLPAALWAGVLA